MFDAAWMWIDHNSEAAGVIIAAVGILVTVIVAMAKGSWEVFRWRTSGSDSHASSSRGEGIPRAEISQVHVEQSTLNPIHTGSGDILVHLHHGAPLVHAVSS